MANSPAFEVLAEFSNDTRDFSTDLVYALHLVNDISRQKQLWKESQLLQIRDRDEDEPIAIHNYVTDGLVRSINDTVEFLQAQSELEPAKLQLWNCLQGFNNLYVFLKRMPLKNALSDAGAGAAEAGTRIVADDLLPAWKVQLDAFNAVVFHLLAANPRLHTKYQEESESNESFTDFVNWLKDEVMNLLAQEG